MNISRIYTETVINTAEITGKSRWSFVVIPVGQPGLLLEITSLGLVAVRTVEIAAIPFLIAAMLTSKKSDQVLEKADQYMNNWKMGNAPQETAIKFAEQIAFGKFVPFRGSPLAEESLVSIAAAPELTASLGLYKFSAPEQKASLGTYTPEQASPGLIETEESLCLVVSTKEGIVIGSPESQISKSIWDRIIDWIEGKITK